MRSEYIFKQELEHILAALTAENRLACEISLHTGLRLGDVLLLKREQVAERFTVQEQKTGKRRVVHLPMEMVARCKSIAGPIYVFSGRLNGRRPRTRQAVWKDLKRAAALFRVETKVNVTPHSCRKVWAVEQLHRDGDLKRVQKLMNHSSEAVTMLYAMADQMVAKKNGKRTNVR